MYQDIVEQIFNDKIISNSNSLEINNLINNLIHKNTDESSIQNSLTSELQSESNIISFNKELKENFQNVLIQSGKFIKDSNVDDLNYTEFVIDIKEKSKIEVLKIKTTNSVPMISKNYEQISNIRYDNDDKNLYFDFNYNITKLDTMDDSIKFDANQVTLNCLNLKYDFTYVFMCDINDVKFVFIIKAKKEYIKFDLLLRVKEELNLEDILRENNFERIFSPLENNNINININIVIVKKEERLICKCEFNFDMLITGIKNITDIQLISDKIIGIYMYDENNKFVNINNNEKIFSTFIFK